MKHCPQCDFIYEDDQSLCDMDGRELVRGPGALLPPKGVTSQPAESRRGRTAGLTLAAVVSGAVLLSAYYVSARRAEPQHAARPPVGVTAGPESTPERVSSASDAAATPARGRPRAADAKAARRAATPVPSRPPAAAKGAKSPKRLGEKRPMPAGTGDKKESKLGSALKKAGRILKRPFKL